MSRPRLEPEFRGIFGPKGDSEEWLEATSKFPNGVPRFNSKQEAIDFMTEYNTHHGGSNPDYPHLMHIFTMLVSWEQIETILLPNIEKARKEPSTAEPVPRDHLDDITGEDCEPQRESNNIYEQPAAHNCIKDVLFRLNLPIHKCTTPQSTMNTLKYLFFHMKCGIFVMIRNGQLRIFAPFVNGDFRNTWGDQLEVEGDGTLDNYYREKRRFYRAEQVEKDKFKWWANGNIICNELTQEKDKGKMQYWGDHFMSALRDMLGEACRTRQMPDCEFFLNKRDYPQLKINVPRGGVPVEPYGFIFNKDDRDPDQDVDLYERDKYKTYAPIVSFYAAAPDRFSDIPWPSSEDWEAACGLVFPQTFMWKKKDKEGVPEFGGNPRDLFTEENFRKFERGWYDDRVATAFFRGTATGGGTTIDNNQRLKVAHLSHEWKDDPEKGGEEPFLDAAIVGWNLRDKKIAQGGMNYLRPNNFDFTAGKHHFTPIYEQSKYKYLVYVDGHCAACRYGFMMRLGSVILKVAPRQVADRMWYFDLLQPYVDHVPVKADLSDLEDQIRWCRENDEKCREIGENAKAFYEKYVGQSALLDYIEMVSKQIAKRFVPAPTWWEAATPARDPPKLQPPEGKCFMDKKNRTSKWCKRCQEDMEADDAKKREEEERERAERKNKRQSKTSLRDRMRKRAKLEAEKKPKGK
ncbi:KDEL motif-containing protein 2 [Seminavis robusta]|uniref:KDEL motif-containing protein 2 n=1 Tax=Seminavis robusta TaxID=568900 RepID=A0A9N8DQK9_9STRA|nr:KDEL motif-containing protein 2 [Seminavis robusta]|eukprot:Sro216_g089300.1 KDEL motif-containing protein 2 (688) ;mRNA; r:26619-28971